mgnify:CR=1 FL=1|jgi:hypothetical protein
MRFSVITEVGDDPMNESLEGVKVLSEKTGSDDNY